MSIFLGLVEKAANLIYDSTISSSTTQPRPGNIERDRVAANEGLLQDYFGPNSVYTPDTFRRRCRMSRELFERIVGDLVAAYPYFTQRN